MDADQQSVDTESSPARRMWFWFGTFLSIIVLTLAVTGSFVLEPYSRARSAAVRLNALGASIDYNDAGLSKPVREAWNLISNRKLAITATAVYCRNDPHRDIRDQDLVHVQAFPELSWLDLRDQPITSNGLRQLTDHKLQGLVLARTEVGGSLGSLAPLATLHKLRVLDLSQTNVTDEDLKGLSTLYQLGSLELAQTAVSSAGMAHLSGLTAISSLDLSDTEVNDDLFPHLAKMRDLADLNLQRTQVTGRQLETLKGTRLRVLRLGDTKLNDDGMAALGHLPHLASLDLANSRVTPHSLRELLKLKKLRSLDLNRATIGDEHLSVIGGLRQLASLKLSGTQITPEGTEHLTPLVHLTRIELDGRLLWDRQTIANLLQLPKLNSIDVRHNAKMDVDFDDVQEQLGAKIRLYEVSEQPRVK